MQYPVITESALRQYLRSLVDGEITDLRFAREPQGIGDPLDVDSLEIQLQEIADRAASEAISASDVDEDQVEGDMSMILFDALKHLPIPILDDPGFWSYLATGVLWPFVRYREPPGSRDADRYAIYLDGSSSSECVPIRMFLRARALDRVGLTTMAGAIPGAVDFWRSHVIRVRTGSHPPMVKALVQQQASDRMTTAPIRDYAKRINRLWSNQVLYLFDERDCERVAEAERESLDIP